jgi:hypothetical protein
MVTGRNRLRQKILSRSLTPISNEIGNPFGVPFLKKKNLVRWHIDDKIVSGYFLENLFQNISKVAGKYSLYMHEKLFINNTALPVKLLWRS